MCTCNLNFNDKQAARHKATNRSAKRAMGNFLHPCYAILYIAKDDDHYCYGKYGVW